MSKTQTGKVASIFVMIGTFGSAFTKWYLLWLFARGAGGVEAVGQYSLILAVATPIFVVSQFGLRTVFVSHEKAWPWSTYIKLRILGSALAILAMVLYAFIFPGVHWLLVFSITLLKVADSFTDIYAAKLQYFNQMKSLGAISIAYALLTVLVATGAVLVTSNVEIALIFSALVAAISAIVTSIITKKFDYSGKGVAEPHIDLLRAGFSVTIAQLFSSLLIQIPILVIGMIANNSVVGVFAAAAYLLTVANLFGSTLQTIYITPLRLIKAERGIEAVARKASSLSRITFSCGLGMMFIITFFGSRVLTFIYGDAFSMDRGTLLILSAAAVLTVAAHIYSVTLSVLNHYGVIARSFIKSCIFSAFIALLGISFRLDPLVLGALVALSGASARVFLLWLSVRTTSKVK